MVDGFGDAGTLVAGEGGGEEGGEEEGCEDGEGELHFGGLKLLVGW